MKRVARALRRWADRIDPPAPVVPTPQTWATKPPELKQFDPVVPAVEQVTVALKGPEQNCWWWGTYL